MLDNLKILDKNKLVTSEISESIFYDYNYDQFLETGAESLEFSVILNEELEDKLIERNFIFFIFNNKPKLFQITKYTDTEIYEHIQRRVFCEFIGLELANDYVRACKIEGDVERYLDTILQDTNYKVGNISQYLKNNIKYTEVTEPTNVYSLLQNIKEIYNNCEIEFDVKIVNSIHGEYELLINCYADGERGNKTYKRFDYDFNIMNVERESDTTQFVSGLIGVGANGITFADIDWDETENAPLSKPKGQDFLLDPEAHEIFGNGNKYILGKYTSDTTDPHTLLLETYDALQEMKKIKVDYKVPTSMTDEEIQENNIGDTVYIVNDKFNPPIQVEARIFKLTISSNGNSIEFSNYKDKKSKIKNWTTEDIIEDLNKFPMKLTQSDIDKIKEFLLELGIKSDEIDALIKKWEDSLDDTVTDNKEVSEDTENYKDVKLDKIDNGLWIGDERIYDVKKYKCAAITASSTESTENSSSSAVEYKNAVEYYSKFSLGTLSNKSGIDTLHSENNPYKIPTLVRYWSKKFGLDPELVFAMIYAESTANPYANASAYGLMQCEKSSYFGIKQTIKFLDGSTTTFTPSYNTLTPKKGGNTTINGVTVDKNISNQIMFGCNELRKNAKHFNYNIFATLVGYNMGPGGTYWCVTHYISDTYGIPYAGTNTTRSISKQSAEMKAKYYEVLDTLKCPWSNYRKKYKTLFGNGGGTATNIEYYLRWYRSIDGQLPYIIDDTGIKRGYGANKTSVSTTTPRNVNTTIKTGVATTIRNKIVAKAKEIVDLHVKYKTATYNQNPRTVDDTKRVKWMGTHYGIKNPYVYDCSSFVSCCYKAAGLTSVYNKSCSAGTLISSATSKSGYKMWKCDTEGIAEALPGDILMDANFKITSSNLTASNMSKVSKTHHTMIYIGDNKVAHASKWAYHPNAIKISDISYYKNKGTAFFLRPWDLVAKDKSATTTTQGTTTEADKVVEAREVTIKGLQLATPKDYISDGGLIADVTINNIEDDEKYPSTVSHVFCHFGIHNLDDEGIESYKSLIKALLVKYPKKPIFVAKEYHVNSQYTDYININTQIDNFNLQMKDFANETQYVVMVNVPNALADEENKYVNSSLTTNGFEMKDKASCDVYYKGYKKAILSLGKKDEASSEPSEPPTDTTKYEDVDITMKSQKEYKYGTCKSVTLKLPSKAEQTFYSKITFTVGPGFKFNQSNLLYLDGSNVTNGALIPKEGATYTIRVYPNPDTSGNIKEKYLGSVAAKYKEGQYYDYKTFKGHNNVVKIAQTYLDNISKFVYNQTTPASFANPSANISKWTTNGKFHIDCSTFIKFIFMGFSFVSTPYNKNLTSLKRNPGYSWSITLPRTAAEQAKYCVEHGYVLNAIDYTNFENLDSGDLLFFDRDNGENGRFMNISHVAMCFGEDEDGDKISIEVTRPGDVVQVRKIKNYTDGLVLVARIKKY